MKFFFDNSQRKNFFLVFFFFLFSFVILLGTYSNSFHNQWVFDDFPNIVNNENIKILDLSWDQIKECFHGRTIDKWDRPLAFLSYALNYHFSGLDVFSFHVFNWVIHYLSFVFLFLTVFELFPLVFPDMDIKRKFFFSAASSLLWAIHPIHVTAVSLVVQRMASMSGMFYLISLYFYVVSYRKRQKLIFWSISVFAFCLGMLSKETCFTLPISVLFIHYFFKNHSSNYLKNMMKKFFGGGLILAIPLLLILKFHQYDFLKLYEVKHFTLTERLMTFPRVLLYYLKLVFIPRFNSLMLIHDFDHSKSFLSPVSTFGSLIFLVLIMIYFYRSRNRWLFFSFSFFVLNHLIEGTFICLDLIYEYRNYIPAMFLFVPLIYYGGLVFSLTKNFVLRVSILTLFGIYFVFMGVTTYQYNGVFKTAFSLWSDNIRKAGNLFTPHYNLALVHFERGNEQEAFHELKLAAGSKSDISTGVKSNIDFILADYYHKQGDFQKALFHYHSVLKQSFNHLDAFIGIANVLGVEKEFEKAFFYLDRAEKIDPKYWKIYFTRASILMYHQRMGEAKEVLVRALKVVKRSSDLWYLLAECFRFEKKYDQALFYYEKIEKKHPDEFRVKLDIISLHFEWNNKRGLEKSLMDFYKSLGGKDVKVVFQEYGSQQADATRVEMLKEIFDAFNNRGSCSKMPGNNLMNWVQDVQE